ncbi:MerR family transcriptional regulator [Gordonia jinhuaensis]|uniref:MerR family transcriptional regulator n=1 Tax=Gordonia jinhuaensis TaxID=1517702 RepID=UPI00166BF003|nr:MerR family transcriptional regulator [Gordonia jinhuaensis]
MRIGEVAERAGVSVRSLRYYEEQGLLTSTRTPGGQRRYDEADVDRVRYLRRLYAAGLSSRSIVDILPCAQSPSEETADVAWVRMTEEREKLDERIAELIRTRDSLDELIAANRRHHRDAAHGIDAASA